uniref:Secreted protein n=1 Tax=Glossina morsitans morsitans TaxID=37546 RepID=A0A1B0GFV5_GLOMM
MRQLPIRYTLALLFYFLLSHLLQTLAHSLARPIGNLSPVRLIGLNQSSSEKWPLVNSQRAKTKQKPSKKRRQLQMAFVIPI